MPKRPRPTTPARIVVVGATSAIASETVRILSERGPLEAHLVGRDAGRLQAVADDLVARSEGTTAVVHEIDVTDADAVGALAAALEALGPIRLVLVAQGSLVPQQLAQASLAAAKQSIMVNAVSVGLVAEAFASVLERQADAGARGGNLVVIGSVAGDRGRRANYVYGAGKGFVETYLEGLRHRLGPKGVKVLTVKPGPTDTPMTADRKAAGQRLTPVRSVAQGIAKAIGRSGTVYLPPQWRLIMFAVRNLPQPVMDRLDL